MEYAANFNLNGNLPLTGFPQIVGNKVIVEYAYPFAISPIGDNIKIDLTAACPASSTSVGLTGYFIADGSCADPASGNRISGVCSSVPFPTVIHCGVGCTDGLIATKAEAFRTNIGLQDLDNNRIADNALPASGAGVRLDRVTIGDNLTVKTTGKIINQTAAIIFNQLEGDLQKQTLMI